MCKAYTSWDRPLSWELGKTQAANLQMRLVPRRSAVWLIQLRATHLNQKIVVSGQLIRGKLGYQEMFENIVIIINIIIMINIIIVIINIIIWLFFVYHI